MKGNENTNKIPLRIILKNFLNFVENCEARRNGESDSYDKEFQELKLFSESLKIDPYYVCKEGEKNVNRKKNRYKDILPFDYTRVNLKDHGDIPGCDYINANFIKGASGSSAYIACQGPLPHTINDFWRMVVECDVQVIVMACNEQESGKHKCEKYWASEEGIEQQFGQVTVWLKKSRNVCPDFLVRTMRIRFPNEQGEFEERNVCQFHYSAWPDHGVPSKVGPLLDMVRLIRDCQTSETLPVLIHCSAGCGRTGTICAIDYVWGLLRLGKITEDFCLFKLVKEMRRQRIAMVQTKDQYILVHRAVKELFQEQLKIIDSHPYANVDLNGLPFQIREELEEPTYETIEFSNNNNSIKSTSKIIKDPEINSLVLAEENGIKLKNDQKAQSHSNKEREENDRSSPLAKIPENSPIKSALFRKPSIIKLKSFFEKSKDEKDKKPGNHLSRAKSDVSTRFYNFSFGSKVQNINSSFDEKSTDTSHVQGNTSSSTSNKIEKPQIKVKPANLHSNVKRSRSLKIHIDPKESNESDKKEQQQPSYNQSNFQKPLSNSIKSNFSKVFKIDNNPIKVNVKHVDMPKLQTVNEKIVKNESSLQSNIDHLHSSKNFNSENDSYPRSFLLENENREEDKSENYNYLNLEGGAGCAQNFIVHSKKKDSSKEMEDIERIKEKYPIRKHGTVNLKNFKSFALNYGEKEKPNSSLTRSHSHVWQTEKSSIIPFKIFTDDNNLDALKYNENNNKTQLLSKNTNSSNNSPSLSIFDKKIKPSDEKNNKLILINSPSDHSSSSLTKIPFNSGLDQKRYLDQQQSSSHLYSNFNSKKEDPNERGHNKLLNEFVPFKNVKGENDSKDDNMHLVKCLSSEDNFSYFSRNSNQGTTSSTSSCHSSGPSTQYQNLSSSNSDEKLDFSQKLLLPNSINQNSIPAKFNSNNVRLGVRERRNSFRQAVWKEAAPSLNDPNPNCINANVNANINPININKPSALNESKIITRINKDYEPIWPDQSNKNSFQLKNSSNNNDNNFHQLFNTNNQTKINIDPQNNKMSDSVDIKDGAFLKSYKRSGSFQDNDDQLTPTTTYISHPVTAGPKTSNMNLNNDKIFQNRVDEIKVLLEELNDTPEYSGGGGGEISSSSLTKMSADRAQHQLRQIKSLKAPSRAHYQQQGQGQGLSCFSFKKPSSLESVRDDSSGANKYIPLPHSNNRYVNDYVSLRTYKTDDNSSHLEDELMLTPIPPPRTKRYQNKKDSSSDNKEYISSSSDNNKDKRLEGFEYRQSSNVNQNYNKMPSETKPIVNSNLDGIANINCKLDNQQDNNSIVKSQLSSQQQQNQNRNNYVTSHSPKSFIRALGIFHSKASDVRNKLSQKISSNQTKYTPTESDTNKNVHSNPENHFGSSCSTSSPYSEIFSSNTVDPSSSKSKQQYL